MLGPIYIPVEKYKHEALDSDEPSSARLSVKLNQVVTLRRHFRLIGFREMANTDFRQRHSFEVHANILEIGCLSDYTDCRPIALWTSPDFRVWGFWKCETLMSNAYSVFGSDLTREVKGEGRTGLASLQRRQALDSDKEVWGSLSVTHFSANSGFGRLIHCVTSKNEIWTNIIHVESQTSTIKHARLL
jgi:hypothetical protein